MWHGSLADQVVRTGDVMGPSWPPASRAVLGASTVGALVSSGGGVIRAFVARMRSYEVTSRPRPIRPSRAAARSPA